MTSGLVLTSLDQGVFSVILNRPDKLNALTPEMHGALGEAFDRFAEDAQAQVCVVKGAGGRAFCAGSDLAGFRADEPGAYPPGGYGGLARRFDLDKPVIAMVDGLCLGGGFELALACDMIIASDRAVFGLPEPRVGLIAIGGGIHRLVRQAGLKRAMVPLLTGRDISAREGLDMGFVSELAASGELEAVVTAICDQIIANAPLAVRFSKALAMWSLDQPTLAEAMAGQASHPSWMRWANSADAIEGPAAFGEKRKPRWQGR